MTKLMTALLVAFSIPSLAFAGQQFNPEVSGERSCEMVEVMSDLTPGKVLYTYRADPTCGSVRTGNSVLIGAAAIRDKAGNVIGTKFTRTNLGEDNGG